MPSPPLVPDDGPIDIAHLKRMTLGDANEMVAINTILIIVNGGPPVIATTGRSGNLFAEKGGELAARSANVPLTNSVIG